MSWQPHSPHLIRVNVGGMHMELELELELGLKLKLGLFCWNCSLLAVMIYLLTACAYLSNSN